MRRFTLLAALVMLAASAKAQDTTVVVRHLAPQSDTSVTVRHLAPAQTAVPAAYGAPRYALRRTDLIAKDPNLATSFAFIFPGGGQYYAGMPGKGLVITALAIGAPIIGYSDVYRQQSYNCGKSPFVAQYNCGGRRDYTPAAIGLGVGIATWLYGIATAGTDAQRWNTAHGVRFVNLPGRLGFAVAVP
ncbi:MAG TPA: hypothetical protein VGI97_10030 [Gemmatimonadaceae bacterium]